MKGLVTDIQRFSLNDGPGIRTTVFLKGCNMHCAWCHNPETIDQKPELLFYPQNCIHCYKCVSVCPSKAHKLIGGEHRLFRDLCIRCGKCAAVCYAQALQMSGKLMSVEEIMREVLQDRAYYTDSAGGVTFSGGEVFCQPDFLLSLTDICRQEGIHTAIETNLAAPFSVMEPILKKTDLVMCDLKLWDSTEHRRWTGIGNEQILINMKKLDTLGIPFIVRTPLIPGITDSDQNLELITDFLQSLQNVQYYELLNFNPLGNGKYEALSKENPFAANRPLPQQKVQALLDALGQKQIAVKFA